MILIQFRSLMSTDMIQLSIKPRVVSVNYFSLYLIMTGMNEFSDFRSFLILTPKGFIWRRSHCYYDNFQEVTSHINLSIFKIGWQPHIFNYWLWLFAVLRSTSPIESQDPYFGTYQSVKLYDIRRALKIPLHHQKLRKRKVKYSLGK